MSSQARLESAIDRLRRSRIFTKTFLPDLAPDEWFWSPPEFTTHVAWQVGHLAVAQYNLCLRRVRGRTADDESLISDAFIDAFKLGSKPVAGATNNLPLEEIQRVFDGVHHQVLTELPLANDAELDVPVEPPHPRVQDQARRDRVELAARIGARRPDRDAAAIDGQAAAAVKCTSGGWGRAAGEPPVQLGGRCAPPQPPELSKAM